MGKRSDIIWRSLTTPEKDWALGEAALLWEDFGQKYIDGSNFKLPRQLHDILATRTQEVGGPDNMKEALVSGLILGGMVRYKYDGFLKLYSHTILTIVLNFTELGSCLQRVAICWGSKGQNITRFIKWKKTPLDSSVRNMAKSLLALHQLLVFRSSTIRLIQIYERAYEQYNEEKRLDWFQELDSEEGWATGNSDWMNLLHSSP
ncbi:hypothetical protein FBU30_001077 [Linnemannia zychae]|nr:hypothetical protein FBU30_001077 [Linnemannia zychae]